MDSAGVVVTESRAPQWAPGQRWTVDSVPLIDIGSADGDEPFLLNGAESAWRTRDNGVLFANSGTQEVRFFDAAGKFVKAIGRRGGGPGEFAQYSFMMIAATEPELVVADENNNRVNVFGVDGSYRRTVRFAPSKVQGRPSLVGVAGDEWVAQSSTARYQRRPGLAQDSVVYFRYRADGTLLNSIVAVQAQPRLGLSLPNQSFTFMSVPMTVEPSVLIDSLTLIVRATERGEIERWGLDGKLVSRHRWLGGQRRRAADFIDRYRQDELATTDSAFRRVIEALYQSDPHVPESVPSHTRVAAGPDGTIWVQHNYLNWEAERRWDVLGRDGRWLGTVDMPARHWLYRAGSDYVLAWHRDELEVEHVTVHRLRRASPP